MSEEWKHQVRVYLDDAHAQLARDNPGDPAFATLNEILARHGAALRNQLAAFEDYVAAAESEGPAEYPLYKWTKVTIEDPEKRAKHLKTFAVRVGDEEIYDSAVADALERDLKPLVGQGLLTRLTRHDSNPAHNPQPPAHLRA